VSKPFSVTDGRVNKLECLSLASIFHPSLIGITKMYHTLAPVQAHKYDTSLNNLLGTSLFGHFVMDKEKNIVTLTPDH
jgi:hypothetical protein